MEAILINGRGPVQKAEPTSVSRTSKRPCNFAGMNRTCAIFGFDSCAHSNVCEQKLKGGDGGKFPFHALPTLIRDGRSRLSGRFRELNSACICSLFVPFLRIVPFLRKVFPRSPQVQVSLFC